MNEEIKAKLLQYINGLESKVEAGGEFLSEQLPLFVTELLAWEFYSSMFLVVVFSLLSLVFAYFMRRCFNYLLGVMNNQDRSDMEGPAVAGIVVSLIVSIIFASVALTNGYNAVKVSVAPRVVLMEKVVQLGNSIRK